VGLISAPKSRGLGLYLSHYFHRIFKADYEHLSVLNQQWPRVSAVLMQKALYFLLSFGMSCMQNWQIQSTKRKVAVYLMNFARLLIRAMLLVLFN
jgi:hypothetical protein